MHATVWSPQHFHIQILQPGTAFDFWRFAGPAASRAQGGFATDALPSKDIEHLDIEKKTLWAYVGYVPKISWC